MTDKALRTPAALIDAGLAPAEELRALEAVAARYAMAIPPAIAALIEPADPRPAVVRPKVKQPRTSVGSSWKPARYSVSGYATWYNNGTTAMRLPRGTTVVICGAGGCVERTVSDYGPRAGHQPVRVIDLMPGDFVKTCGCALWEGTQYVTVHVY